MSLKPNLETPPNRQVSGIEVDELCIEYSPGNKILDSLSLRIHPGEIVALVGASGCGKSTLLRAIANLLPILSGDIRFDNEPADQSDGWLSYVFQDPTLLPWRTVLENVRLPLELGRMKGDATREQDFEQKIRELLNSVGLRDESFNQFPRQLSGGMRMRSSLARALITDPNILLLDEPFAALDDLLRTKMNELVLDLWQARERTIVFVTHNIAEAVYLSHRVAVFGKGAISQVIENPLTWPRTKEQRTTTEFAQFYGSISAALAEVQP